MGYQTKEFNVGDLVAVIDVYGVYGNDREFIIINKVYENEVTVKSNSFETIYEDAIYEMLSIRALKAGKIEKSTAIGTYLTKL